MTSGGMPFSFLITFVFQHFLSAFLNLDFSMQCLALSACTTLVSVEPKLTIETRNHVLKVKDATQYSFSCNNNFVALLSILHS